MNPETVRKIVMEQEDGYDAEESDVVSAIREYGKSDDEIEDAIHDALMAGLIYRPERGKLAAIA